MRTELSFISAGERCAARLYEPDGAAGPLPCVLMGQGFSLTQNDGLAGYAEPFTAAGLVVLTFDYRSFGDSAGEPRQRFSARRQRQDWIAAHRFAGGLAAVDPERIVPWSYSFGGGHLVSLLASGALRPPAAIAVAPFVDGLRRLAATPPGAIAPLLVPVGLDAIGVRRTIPVTGEPGEPAAMSLPGEAEGFARAIEPGSGWRNEVAAGVFATVAFHRPWRRARRIEAPLWVALGERDITTDADSVRGLAQRARRGELHRYPFDHFDFLLPEHARSVAADQIAFLERVGVLR